MTETQKSFRRIWKKFIGWTSLLLVAAVGVMILMANLRLHAIQQQSAATEAKLAATIVDREVQITILQNALNRTTSDLSSRESLIARLSLLIGQLKEASGIAEKAGLVLLTLADQNSVAFKVSQSTLSPDQREKLAENLVLIKYARTFPAFEIQITGHADDTWEGKADHPFGQQSSEIGTAQDTMPYRVVQLFGGRRDEWTLIGEYDAFPNDGGGGKQIEEGPVAEDRNKTVS